MSSVTSPAHSVVIPLYNEEDNVRELVDRLVPVLDKTGQPFEILFVDDGSRDQTAAMVRAAHATDPRVKVVRLGGAGRGFSSGAGISEEDHANPGTAGTPADVLDAANRAVRSIVNLPQPVVAVVQGPTAGVGASLALASDVVLASEKAFFMLAFTKIGLMPTVARRR